MKLFLIMRRYTLRLIVPKCFLCSSKKSTFLLPRYPEKIEGKVNLSKIQVNCCEQNKVHFSRQDALRGLNDG